LIDRCCGVFVGEETDRLILTGLSDESALLKHEIAYALGQMQDPYAVPFLIDVLKNKTEDSMVRHEAGEALGAIAVTEGIPALEEHLHDPIPEVSETCQLALERIRYVQSKVCTLDQTNTCFGVLRDVFEEKRGEAE